MPTKTINLKVSFQGHLVTNKRPDHNIQNAQVKVVSSNNLNCLGPIKVTNNKNEPIERPMFNQLFSNTENRLDSKNESNLPLVNDAQNKKMFTL